MVPALDKKRKKTDPSPSLVAYEIKGGWLYSKQEAVPGMLDAKEWRLFHYEYASDNETRIRSALGKLQQNTEWPSK